MYRVASQILPLISNLSKHGNRVSGILTLVSYSIKFRNGVYALSLDIKLAIKYIIYGVSVAYSGILGRVM